MPLNSQDLRPTPLGYYVDRSVMASVLIELRSSAGAVLHGVCRYGTPYSLPFLVHASFRPFLCLTTEGSGLSEFTGHTAP